MVVNGVEYIVLLMGFWSSSLLWAANVPELKVLMGETLLNQDKGSVYFIVMYFLSLTYMCISTSVSHKLQRLFSAALWFIHTPLPWLYLTGSRYAHLKITALFDREISIFLRICCFG